LTEAEYDLRRFIDEVETLLKNGTYGLSALKTLMGTLTEPADIDASLLARVLATWQVATKVGAYVVADKNNPSTDEQALLAALRKQFYIDLVDDDDVADAKMDFTAYSTIVVGSSSDVAKLAALTDLAVPIVFTKGEHAATIGKMATVGAGNYGTSTGTQWDVTNNSHPTMLIEAIGVHTLYAESGDLTWLLSTALAAGVGTFANVKDEATHLSLTILPIDGINSDGVASPEIRYFLGLPEVSKYAEHTWEHVDWIAEWLVHQIALVTMVYSLTKSKIIEEMLGKGKFKKQTPLYDYLVHDTTGAAPYEVISEQEIGSVMERLEWIKNAVRRGTGTILPLNTSLYDILWVDRSLDEQGSFNWDTSAYTTVEQDISALFTTALTGTKRREYQVYLDLSNVEGDANFDECYIRVYVKINGTYQCIDKATKTKANLQAEPGVPIEVPKTAEDAKITLQMKTALAVDKTIDYSWVEEKMEY